MKVISYTPNKLSHQIIQTKNLREYDRLSVLSKNDYIDAVNLASKYKFLLTPEPYISFHVYEYGTQYLCSVTIGDEKCMSVSDDDSASSAVFNALKEMGFTLDCNVWEEDDWVPAILAIAEYKMPDKEFVVF